MSADVSLALAVAAVLTLLIAVIEIVHRADIPLSACLDGRFAVYLAILLIGNTGSTLAAACLLALPAPRAASAGVPAAFWYAFVGVFGFEGILQHVNLTFMKKGMLSIHDWTTKARDSATASSVRRHSGARLARELRTAAILQRLPADELNTHVLCALGPGALERMTETAAQSGANPHHYKALVLAHDAPDRADALSRVVGRARR